MAYSIPAMRLTEAGKRLYAKAHSGTKIIFTRIAVGSGYITGDEEDIEQLVDPVDAVADILEQQVMDDGTFRIGVRIYSADRDFYMREIGIMANDPDDGEILYAYCNYGDNADYITTFGGSYPVTQYIDIYVDIGAAENVTVDITGITIVTPEDIKNKLEQKSVSSLPTTHKVFDFADEVIYQGIERCTVEYDPEKDQLEINSASNSGNKYGMAQINMTELLSGADIATVEFDVFIPTGSRWYISLVNVEARPGASDRINYDTAGVALYLGTKDGTSFLVNGQTLADVPLDTWIHISCKFNNRLKTIICEIKNKSTDQVYMSEEKEYMYYSCAQITAIEAYTWYQSNLKLANSLAVTLGDTPSNNIRYIVDENGYKNEYMYEDGSATIIGSSAVKNIPQLMNQTHTHNNIDALDMISEASISEWNAKAPLISPEFAGEPTAPTASDGTNTTQVATTAFVHNALSNALGAPGETTDVIVLGSSDELLNIDYYRGDPYTPIFNIGSALIYYNGTSYSVAETTTGNYSTSDKPHATLYICLTMSGEQVNGVTVSTSKTGIPIGYVETDANGSVTSEHKLYSQINPNANAVSSIIAVLCEKVLNSVT